MRRIKAVFCICILLITVVAAVSSGRAYAVETIVPMKDDAGIWRISGYFIK